MNGTIRQIKLRRSVGHLLNESYCLKNSSREFYKTPKDEMYMTVYHEFKLIGIDTILLRDKYNIDYDVDVHKLFLNFLYNVNNNKYLYLYDFVDTNNEKIFG